MNKFNFLRYAELKNQATTIETELENLKPFLLEDMASVEDKPIELEDKGIFTVTKYKDWKYTNEVKKIKEALDDRKKEEEAKGIAIFEISRRLVFKNKNNINQ